MELFWLAISTIAIGVFGCVAWFWGSNMVLDTIYPPKGPNAGDNIRKANQIRPWLFLGPAILFLTMYLVYPVIDSLWRSLHNSTGSRFVGVDNYTWLLGDGKFRESMRNNMLWLLVVPALSTLFGLIAAQLTDRIRWGNIGKSLIFMPMAISFVGAGVIWKFIYEFRAEGETQIGLLNWIVTRLGGDPQIWLTLIPWNNFFLMIVLVWIQTGFAMVILSAALRGIPEETIEAAILDGASPLQVFMKIKVPQIMGTIAVVWTTITIVVLKVFDIVFVMTNGQWGTQVLANLMYDWMFRGSPDYGRGSAIAIVLMILVTPIMVWNIRNARKEVR
ncbi:sugar ABC transporter permease [Paracoccus sp. Z330]|uniref:Maltose ABC transporter membrane protein /trehalose ABC transporter membrane protein /sucrose ABC transporter membrane protein n=2 Tax=Paracoccus TaxID=265 RepID=A0A1I0AN11_9RHOB|nr:MULTISPECIES: sugar ABC transporter permease [Paracoccus]MDB6179243.1 sugar ABC transporter permease [Paracoccus onchidii]SES95778.1 maltose ABC transporter membrane protein /trehalose ABC transporter membrane protein /sucrose ABC transporter membrane protein [Paracoccus homiensis]